MLNENAKKWVEALRSGRFQQTKHYLEINGKYCCLGVACRIALESGVSLSLVVNSDLDNQPVRFDGYETYLPERVEKWINLSSSDGEYEPGRVNCNSLTHLNDNGATFAEIADLIESEPEGLFATQGVP